MSYRLVAALMGEGEDYRCFVDSALSDLPSAPLEPLAGSPVGRGISAAPTPAVADPCCILQARGPLALAFHPQRAAATTDKLLSFVANSQPLSPRYAYTPIRRSKSIIFLDSIIKKVIELLLFPCDCCECLFRTFGFMQTLLLQEYTHFILHYSVL